MSISKTLFFCLCFYIFNLSSYSFSKTYFVSKNGSNSQIGSIKFPFRTISFAVKKLRAGDTCFVRKGDYAEVITFGQSGKFKSPIVLKNYKNEQVALVPKYPKTAWKKFKGNIYRVKVKDSVIQLFFNKKSLMQACYPNVDEGDIRGLSWGKIHANSNKKVYFQGLKKFHSIEGAHFLGVCGRGLVAINGSVQKQNGDYITINNNAWYWDKQYTNLYTGKGKGFLIGNLKFLDSPGEWFYYRGYLYFWPPTLNNFQKNIKIRTCIKSMKLSDCSYIEIDGVDILGGSFSLINSRCCTIKNLKCVYPTPFFKFNQGFERIMPKNENENRQSILYSGNGCEVSGNNNLIENCYIGKSWGDGLTIWGVKNTIKNCLVKDCDWLGIDCSPLKISGENHLVEQSSFCRAARNVISFSKLKKSKFIYNEIYFGGLLNDDLGLICCYDTDSENTEISYNWIHDNLAPYFGPGIYLDNNSSNLNIHHNVVWNNSVGVTINRPSKNVKIWNNTLLKNKYNMGSWPLIADFNNIHIYNNITDSELSAANYQPFYGSKIDSNIILKDIYKYIVNPRMLRFDCYKNILINNRGLKTDNETKHPDLGAYSNTNKYWIPGVDYEKLNAIPHPKISKYEYFSDYEILKGLIFYLFTLFFLIKTKFLKVLNWSNHKIVFLFTLRVTAGAFLFSVYYFYYLDKEVADVFKCFDFAHLLYDNLYISNKSDFYNVVFGKISKVSDIQNLLINQEVLFKMSDYTIFTSNHFIIRLNAFLMVITHGSYVLNAMFFIILSFIGSLAMFRFVKNILDVSEWKLIIAFFITPSFLFWSSGIMRESLLIFGIGLGLFFLQKFYVNFYKNKKLIYVIIFCFMFYIVFLIKAYVIFALLPSLIGYTTSYMFKNEKRSIIAYFLVLIIYLLVTFIGLPFLTDYNILAQLTYIQNDNMLVATEMHANTVLEINKLDSTFKTFIYNIPRSINNLYFEPIPSKTSHFGIYLAFIENLILFGLLILCVLFYKKPTLKVLKVILFCFSYVFIFSILIGEVVPIVGGIVRYRSLFLPFLIIILLVLVDDDKIKFSISSKK